MTMSWNTLILTVALCAICETASADHAGAPASKVPAPPPTVAANNADVTAVLAEVKKELGGYNAFTDCTYYTNRFHQFAAKRNLDVRSITASCPGEDVGHAFNMIRQTDGKYYFLEPQGSGIHQPGFTDPNNPDGKALCQAMFGHKLNSDGTCPCKIGYNDTKPFQPNPNPTLACALSEEFRNRGKSLDNFRECRECCVSGLNNYMTKNNLPLFKEWNKQCVTSCASHFRPKDLDTSPVSVPRVNDSMAVAEGRSCVDKATVWSVSSKWEQCRGCCYDGAREGKYPIGNVGSCLAACRAEYQ